MPDPRPRPRPTPPAKGSPKPEPHLSARPDDLLTWQRIRATIDWPNLPPAHHPPHPPSPLPSVPSPASPAPHIGPLIRAITHQAQRLSHDPARTRRLLAAWHQAHAEALSDRPRPLGLPLLATWQQTVLGLPATPAFRTTPAFAKRGRERYGIHHDTPRRFAACLAEATPVGSAPAPTPPVPARAARAYLDVAFFHPFPDGNGRAALLALAYVLAREGHTVDQIGPLQIPRWAEDRRGAAALPRLVATLISATTDHTARPHSPNSRAPFP